MATSGSPWRRRSSPRWQRRRRWSMGASCRSSPGSWRSSATAMSRASARRCMPRARRLPTFRAHNEQAMAHAAIAFAKASRRRRMMACTSSIGPGATNMVTAAAVAHVNRLPVLLLPGDVFAEPPARSGVAAGRGFRRRHGLAPTIASARSRAISTASPGPSRSCPRFDARDGGADRSGRMRPRDARALPGRADGGLRLSRRASSPSASGTPRRAAARRDAVGAAVALIKAAQAPLVVAGGGVLYSARRKTISRPSATAHGIPVAETQAGKSRAARRSSARSGRGRRHRHGRGQRRWPSRPTSFLRSARGCRISPPARWALFADPACRRIVGLNTQPFDAGKHRAHPLVADAKAGLAALDAALGGWAAPASWTRARRGQGRQWLETAARYTAAGNADLAERRAGVGAVQRRSRPSDIVRLRRRRLARRIAQALARRRARRLPHRIRLFLHGLRDRRRARRQDGRSGRARSS